MVLGASEIKKLIKEGVLVLTEKGSQIRKPLVEEISEEQIELIEGTSLDLRIGYIYAIDGSAELRLRERITPPTKLLASFERGDMEFLFEPKNYYLVQTIEKVNLPSYLLGYITPRTTMFRSGLFFQTSFISPNYQGRLTVGVENLSNFPILIELGFRILTICFFKIEGEATPYRGIWQGGRVSTEGKKERPF